MALSLLPRVGPTTLSRLYYADWTPSSLVEAFSTSPLQKLPETRTLLENYLVERGPVWEQVERYMQMLDQRNVTLLTPGDSGYPPLLKAAPDHPVLLFVTGSLDALSLPAVAIVGSRNASAAGLRHAYRFASDLASHGLVVVSGLAAGVDGSAHQGAVDQKCPTIAVMGTGSGQIYPRRHKVLAEQIVAEGGALITELLPDKGPLAAHFPRRNRIISGLSTGVLVVEAAVRSGSLITARQALEQGREVFAIPGAIDHPGSRGCHALIREGAVLVETTQHMMDELAPLLGQYEIAEMERSNRPEEMEVCVSLSGDQNRVLNAIGFATTFLEEVAPALALPQQTLLSLVMELELLGWIESVGGGYRRIR